MEKENEYLNLAKRAFLVNNEIHEINGDFPKKEELLNGYKEAEKNLETWGSFIQTLKQDTNFKVRDMKEAVQAYSFVANLSDWHCDDGTVFAINFIFKLYGFYFVKYTENDKHQYDVKFSYFPINEKTERFHRIYTKAIFPRLCPF